MFKQIKNYQKCLWDGGVRSTNEKLHDVIAIEPNPIVSTIYTRCHTDLNISRAIDVSKYSIAVKYAVYHIKPALLKQNLFALYSIFTEYFHMVFSCWHSRSLKSTSYLGTEIEQFSDAKLFQEPVRHVFWLKISI